MVSKYPDDYLNFDNNSTYNLHILSVVKYTFHRNTSVLNTIIVVESDINVSTSGWGVNSVGLGPNIFGRLLKHFYRTGFDKLTICIVLKCYL